MGFKLTILFIFLVTSYRSVHGAVNITCSTIASDVDYVIKSDREQSEATQGELRSYEYNGRTYYYNYNPFYYDNDDSNNNMAISTPISNNFVKFLVSKVLTRPGQWRKFDDFFQEDIVQNLNIRYRLNFPCTEKNKGNQTITVVWSKNNALNGIFKGIQSTRHTLEIVIDVIYKDGFDGDCDHSLCVQPYTEEEYKPVFCQVTNMLYLEWRSRNNLYDDYYDYDRFDLTQCKSETSDEQIAQFTLFHLAMGLLHLITFVLLTAYRRKIHKHIITQTDRNRKKIFLFWSFIISLWLLFFYTVVISIYYKTSSASSLGVFLLGENIYFVLSLLISAMYVIFFMILHFPVTFCCAPCCSNNETSSTDLCIPGTCFSSCCCCSYPFQSIAFYVLNSIPHIVLMLITMLILEFSNSPVPSVTVLVYSVILLFANIVANAYTLYLITSFCKTKDGWCRKIGKRCCYFLFGIVVALVTNILTILVVISLVDFLFSDTEETNYTALIPGVLVTVAGWYFSGDITKYTGVNDPLDENNTDLEKGAEDKDGDQGGYMNPETYKNNEVQETINF